MKNAQKIKERVQKHYTQAIEIRAGGEAAGCCGSAKAEEPSQAASGGCCGGGPSLVQLSGYQTEELRGLPEDAVQSSFGCGNPVSFAGVEPGQTVVDIGSGAGIDCLLAAQRVGPAGRVIGLDMTPAMIKRAEANARTAGADNVEFRLGEAESMPIEDGRADWIVSNCVINLAPDKKKVFREAYRVLKPGGRISVSDIVADLPRPFRSSELYASCLSGALPEREYLHAVSEAGFSDVVVVARHVYDVEQLAGLFGDRGWVGALLRSAARPRSRWLRAVLHRFLGNVASVQVSAVKPASARVAA
jgi:ubiquinone/menaquinone biosynthesis C-methylase UbiE